MEKVRGGGHFEMVALFEPVPQVQRERIPAKSVPKIIFYFFSLLYDSLFFDAKLI